MCMHPYDAAVLCMCVHVVVGMFVSVSVSVSVCDRASSMPEVLMACRAATPLNTGWLARVCMAPLLAQHTQPQQTVLLWASGLRKDKRPTPVHDCCMCPHASP